MESVRVWILLVLVALALDGCRHPGEGEFAIYLPARKASVREISKVDLNNLKLEHNPILSVLDIISYAEKTHEIELTPSAYERIRQLEVPVDGRPFVVCVGRNRIYWGAFWHPVSSIAFNGVIMIWKPFDTDKHVIQIQQGLTPLGYPSSEFFAGEDPRSNQEIFESLQRAGKLK